MTAEETGGATPTKDETAEETGDATPTKDELHAQLGAGVLQLALGANRTRFITRRVDTVEFLDATTSRRTVECHLDLDSFQDAQDWPFPSGQMYVPLTRQQRPPESSTTFKVVDESGNTLPRLTKQEERSLVVAGLVASAEQVLGQPPQPSTQAFLGAVVLGGGDVAFFNNYCPTADQKLKSDQAFQELLTEAHDVFYLIAVLPRDRAVGRRVITYSFEEQWITKDKRGRPWRWLRLVPQYGAVVQLDAPTLADCLSYHLEVLAPPDLDIPADAASMIITNTKAGERKEKTDDDRSDRRAHFFYEAARQDDDVAIHVPLVLASTGLTLSMQLAAFVACLLVLYTSLQSWMGHQGLFANVEAWVTVLLAAPAIATAIIAIRSGHRMTSRLFRDMRLTVALPAFVLFCAAVALPGQPSGIQLQWLRSLALAAVAVTIWRLAAGVYVQLRLHRPGGLLGRIMNLFDGSAQ
jgi:hypothetical protein